MPENGLSNGVRQIHWLTKESARSRSLSPLLTPRPPFPLPGEVVHVCQSHNLNRCTSQTRDASGGDWLNSNHILTSRSLEELWALDNFPVNAFVSTFTSSHTHTHTHTKRFGKGCSSAGRASDRHAAHAGLIPRRGQGFFFFSLPELTFSADSLTMSVPPRVQPHALTSVCTLKILWSMSEFGGLWKH